MRICSLRRLAVLGVLSLCVSLSRTSLATRWVVPASAHANGANNTIFRTDLNIDNPSGTGVSVVIRFLPADHDNSSLPTGMNFFVPAGEHLLVSDVVGQLGGSGGGSIFVDTVDASVTGLVVSSRTYNKLPDRTFGMFLPGLNVDDALPAGETGHLIFLAKSDVYRSNVGFASPTGTAGTATVKLYGGSGQLLGTASRDVKPFGQTQINDVFAAASAAATTVARAEIVATIPLFIYATIIDNRTGDPFPLISLRITQAAKELVLTAAAHAPGANGSNFRSDLRVFNTENAAGSLTLTLYPVGGSQQTKVIPLAAHQLLALDDVILATFGLSSASGAIGLTSDRELFAMSRTYNVAPDGSTSGQELPAVPVGGYVETGDVARLAGITNVDARTNIIFFNPGATPIQVSIELKGQAARSSKLDPLAIQTRTLAPFAVTQFNDVISGLFGITGSYSGYVEVKELAPAERPEPLVAPPNSFWALATVIDSVSNDPGQVGPVIQRSPSGSGSDCIDIPTPPLGRIYTYSETDVAGGMTINATIQQSTTAFTETDSTGTFKRFGTGVTSQDLTIKSHYSFQSNILFMESVQYLSGSTTTLSATYVPAWATDPVQHACAGETWTINSVRSTTVLPSGTVVSNTPSGDGRVISVNESLTIPNGSFTTYHYRKTLKSGSLVTLTQDFWNDVQTGVMVKYVGVDASGGTTTEVLSLGSK